MLDSVGLIETSTADFAEAKDTDDNTDPGDGFSSDSYDTPRPRHRSKGRREIRVGAIIAAIIAMVCRAQSDANFIKRPVYTDFPRAWFRSLGNGQACGRPVDTGRLQKMARGGKDRQRHELHKSVRPVRHDNCS